ncbi:MAG: type II toxin-antitoxin system HicA family toxin [Verrucomicrobia bacterium]|nr:MAG: type II toxin-antitoxin system HicA family toxin [Verrucomicrobiota bacterium]
MDDLHQSRGVTPKLPSLSSRQLTAALRKAGFRDAPRRGKGSHIALFRPGETPRLVVVPLRKTLPTGTVRGIIRQAGISREELLDLLG